MRSLTITLASSLLAVALAACGGSSSSSPKPATAERPATMEDVCPVAVTGTTVVAEDTETGGALVFTTTGDVTELRRRVTAMAAMHNDHHMGGAMPEGDKPAGPMEGEGGMHDMHAMHGGGEPPPGMQALMAAKATASDIDGGARVDLEASPGDASAVQAALREHAQMMAGGSCGHHDMPGGEAHGDMHHHD